ncbi:MAG: hypothetical protein E7261_06575 [Lachnospiraceae bacterium]|nr:hypothetical protein [Lachnospiraceae bacterium]
MLSKLLKYELKATARWFLPLYIALIALTLLNKLTMVIELPDLLVFNLLKGLLIVFYVLVIIFTTVVTMILLIVRFYKNLYTDEGYLTHTLPVKPSAQLNCKILSGCIWTVSSFFMQIISLFILFAGTGLFTEVADVFTEIGEFLKEAGLMDNLIVTLIIFAITMLISLLYSLLMMYCSISLGSLFNKHKIIGAIFSYFVIYFVIQLISMILMFVGIETPILYDIAEVEDFSIEVFNFVNLMMIFSGGLSLICSTIFYFLNHFVISKKLNLE